MNSDIDLYRFWMILQIVPLSERDEEHNSDNFSTRYREGFVKEYIGDNIDDSWYALVTLVRTHAVHQSGEEEGSWESYLHSNDKFEPSVN